MHISGSNHVRLLAGRHRLNRLYRIYGHSRYYPPPVYMYNRGEANARIVRLYAHGKRRNSRVATIKGIASRRVRRNAIPTRAKSGYRKLYDVKWELD